MPINPLIALQTQTPDLGQTIGNALTGAANINAMRENRQTAGLRKQAALTEADQARLKSTAITAAQIIPPLEANDIEGTRSILTGRRDQFKKLGLDTRDIDQGLVMLDQDPVMLKAVANNVIQMVNMFDGKSTGGGIGTYNPRDYTTDSWAKFVMNKDPSTLKRYEPQRNVEIGGVPHVFDPESGQYVPASVGGGSGGGASKTKPITADDVAANQAKIKGAEATAKAEAEAQAIIDKKAGQADSLEGILSEADKLFDDASGSLAGAAGSAIKGAVGYSDKSTQANAKLKMYSGWALSNVPRMEGPQGEKDVEIYKEMAAKIGDPTIPVEDRRAASDALRQLNSKYRTAVGSVSNIGRFKVTVKK